MNEPTPSPAAMAAASKICDSGMDTIEAVRIAGRLIDTAFAPQLAELARFVVDHCDEGHAYAKLDGANTRCPHCLAIGLGVARAELAAAKRDAEDQRRIKEAEKIILLGEVEKNAAQREEVARLKAELESHAWEISPAMAQTRIDQQNAELAAKDKALEEMVGLVEFLHSHQLHPNFQYDTTKGPRKAFDVYPPDGEGWERNTARGRDGWERFDYHEEAYWRRLKPARYAKPGEQKGEK